MHGTRVALLFLTALVPSLFARNCDAGTVVDVDGKPLAGVHVVATWSGDGPTFHSRNQKCFRLEATVTGVDGQYDLPLLSGNFNPIYTNRARSVRFFKVGYEFELTQPLNADPVKMQPYSGTFKDRQWRAYSIYAPGCPDAPKKLVPVIKAIVEDATLLAKTVQEQRIMISHYEYEYNLGRFGEEAAAKIRSDRLQQMVVDPVDHKQ